jgi:hypothetical protein
MKMIQKVGKTEVTRKMLEARRKEWKWRRIKMG